MDNELTVNTKWDDVPEPASVEIERLRAELAEAQRHARVLASGLAMYLEDAHDDPDAEQQAAIDYVKGLKP